jgi:alpha-1,2-mannosyltransferase
VSDTGQATRPTRAVEAASSIVLFILALAVRLAPALTGGGPFPVDNYDPSVYYAAAVGLGEGRMPYRDFLLLHPPGLMIFLQPFVALGSLIGDPSANLVARVSFMVMGAVTTVLIFRLAARRGLVPGLLSAGFYLTFFPAIYTERTTRLEGLASFLVVVALVVLVPLVQRGQIHSWRLVLGGALVGLGATVKIWGVVLLAALCLWLWISESFRAALLAGIGGLVAVAAVLGPFVGPQFWRMVVLDQLGRPALPVGLLQRLGDIIGLGQLDAAPPPLGVMVALFALVIVAAALAARSRPGRLYLALGVVSIATLLAGPSWYVHYAVFSAAPLALVLGAGLAEVSDRLARGWRVAGGLLLAALVATGVVVQLQIPEGNPFPAAEVGAVLKGRSGCVTTDNPVSLILTDTLRRDLRRGCPLMVDLSGYIYDISRADGSDPQRSANPEFQRELLRYFDSGSTAVIMRLWPDSFSPGSQAIVRTWPELAQFSGHAVRDTSSALK